MSEQIEKTGSTDSTDTTTVGTITATTSESTKKSKQKKKESPLAKDAPKELHAKGKFFGGIAEMKIGKTNLKMSRTQRIILTDENGKHYEFLRSKNPY